MMFKVISMHTKPLKHAKYIEILTNTSQNHDCFKISYRIRFLSKTMFAPKLIICMNLILDVPDAKNKNTTH